jgi:DNA-3-methyladenine glycosylase
MSERLPRAFYRRGAEPLARALLGQRLVRVKDSVRTAGIIVETEAYLGAIDKAAHSYRGRTARNASMWKEGGHAYVYFIYGMHWCLNVVARDEGVPEAVLIRAIEPVEGIDAMRTRRARAKRDRDLCSGPGKLCAALAIDRALDGADLVESDELFIEKVRARAHAKKEIAVTARIGVAYAEEWADRLLRFHLASEHVSGRR